MPDKEETGLRQDDKAEQSSRVAARERISLDKETVRIGWKGARQRRRQAMSVGQEAGRQGWRRSGKWPPPALSSNPDDHYRLRIDRREVTKLPSNYPPSTRGDRKPQSPGQLPRGVEVTEE